MRTIFFAILWTSFSPFVYSSEPVIKEFEASSIKKLEIKNPKGEITVLGMKGLKKIAIKFEKIEFDSKCKFQQEENAGVLKLSVVHESGLFEKANCVGKLTVNVPSILSEVEVSTGSGQVKLAGVEAAMDFKTATGNVDIKAETLKSVSGKTATGNIALTYLSCPKRADIDLMTATGDAEVVLGASCKIRATHKSATGDLFNEMGDNEDYQVLVAMKSASGNLKIKKLSK